MAFASVSPLAAPWQRLGLRYLLSPVDLPPELSLAAEQTDAGRPGTAERTRPAAPRRDAGSAPSRESSRPAAVPANRPTVRPAARQTAEPFPGSHAAASRRAVSPPDATPAREETDWRPLAPALWPAPWQERLARTRIQIRGTVGFQPPNQIQRYIRNRALLCLHRHDAEDEWARGG